MNHNQPINSKEELPKLMTSEFSGKTYIVTKIDKSGVPLEKFDITEQMKAYALDMLDRLHQATVNSELIKGEPSYMSITKAINAERKRVESENI